MQQLETNLNFISSLPADPAMTTQALQQEFDKAGNVIKDFINNILEAEIESDIASCLAEAKSYADTQIGAINLEADNISYDNTASHLVATKVQGAIDELKTITATNASNITSLQSSINNKIKTQTITISDTTPANFRGTIQGANLTIPTGYTFIGIALLNRSSSPLYVDVIPNVMYNGTNYLTYVNFINHEGRAITTTVKLTAIYLKNSI